MMDDSLVRIIAALIITLWVGLAYTFLVLNHGAHKRSSRPRRAAPPVKAAKPGAEARTELADLVWKAHTAALDLDAAISVGTSEEVIAAARKALTAAANLSAALRARELGTGTYVSPEPRVGGALDKNL